MRIHTIFVPYVLLPDTKGTLAELDDAEKECERREAGSAEWMVVHLWHTIMFSTPSLEEMDVFSFARAAWVGFLNLTSNAQSPSISLENPTSHLAHTVLIQSIRRSHVTGV